MDRRIPVGGADIAALSANARDATHLLRTLGNEIRLKILCLLAEQERSVGDIELWTGARQPTVSQQLARLRADGVVEARRDGRTVYYSLACPRTREVLELLGLQYRRPAVVSTALLAVAGKAM